MITARYKVEVLFETNLFQIFSCDFSQNFVILLTIFDWSWRNHLSKTCDESTVWVEFLCSAGCVHFIITKTITEIISTKNCFLCRWSFRRRRASDNLFKFGSKVERFNQILTKFTFLSTLAIN